MKRRMALFSFIMLLFFLKISLLITTDKGDNNSYNRLVEDYIPINYTKTILNRSTADRFDDSEENQIHVMYVIPKDGSDEELDINGKIATSVTAFQRWLLRQTSDRALRMDTYNGSLDISYWRLNRTDEDMQKYGAFVVTEIENELKLSGPFNASNKKYAVYYDGGSTYACGGAAWPPYVVGQYAAMYLKAYPTSYSVPCFSNVLTSSIDNPKYWEFAMLHDLFHTLGAVSPDAPNYTDEYPAHVSDPPSDLMYTGTAPWNPSILDYGKDDYYGHNRSDLLDIKKSSYLQQFDYTPETLPLNTTSSTTKIPTTSNWYSSTLAFESISRINFISFEAIILILAIFSSFRYGKKNT